MPSATDECREPSGNFTLSVESSPCDIYCDAQMPVERGKHIFSCEVCENKFMHYLNHTLVHSNERPFSCQVCNWKFTQFKLSHAHSHR